MTPLVFGRSVILLKCDMSVATHAVVSPFSFTPRSYQSCYSRFHFDRPFCVGYSRLPFDRIGARQPGILAMTSANAESQQAGNLGCPPALRSVVTLLNRSSW